MKSLSIFFIIFVLITPVVHAGTDEFEIKGKIIDKEKVLMKRLMDEGAKWDGVFDPVGRRVVFVRVFSGDKKLAEMNKDLDKKETILAAGVTGLEEKYGWN